MIDCLKMLWVLGLREIRTKSWCGRGWGFVGNSARNSLHVYLTESLFMK